MSRFSGKNIFVTITNIVCNFSTTESTTQIHRTFGLAQRALPWIAYEKTPGNQHVHIVFMLKKSKQFSRKMFAGLLELFGSTSLNIQTFSRKQTYKCAINGLPYKNKPRLWLFEKLAYCSASTNKECFDPEKYAEKIQTVVNCVNPPTKEIEALKKEYLEFAQGDKPATENQKPSDFLFDKIYKGMGLQELKDMYQDPSQARNLRKYILCNFKKLKEMIEQHEEIQDAAALAAQYPESVKTYRTFQQQLTDILNDQHDRHIHTHVDGGNSGKNYWCAVENMRTDTLVIQTACTKDIAYAWDPKSHKRIIVDVPRGKMQFLNTQAIENLKNGQMFSTKYLPKFKQSFGWKPNIVIIGNENIDRATWTKDRLTESWTHKDINYELRMGNYEEEMSIESWHQEFGPRKIIKGRKKVLALSKKRRSARRLI